MGLNIGGIGSFAGGAAEGYRKQVESSDKHAMAVLQQREGQLKLEQEQRMAQFRDAMTKLPKEGQLVDSDIHIDKDTGQQYNSRQEAQQAIQAKTQKAVQDRAQQDYVEDSSDPQLHAALAGQAANSITPIQKVYTAADRAKAIADAYTGIVGDPVGALQYQKLAMETAAQKRADSRDQQIQDIGQQHLANMNLANTAFAQGNTEVLQQLADQYGHGGTIKRDPATGGYTISDSKGTDHPINQRQMNEMLESDYADRVSSVPSVSLGDWVQHVKANAEQTTAAAHKQTAETAASEAPSRIAANTASAQHATAQAQDISNPDSPTNKLKGAEADYYRNHGSYFAAGGRAMANSRTPYGTYSDPKTGKTAGMVTYNHMTGQLEKVPYEPGMNVTAFNSVTKDATGGQRGGGVPGDLVPLPSMGKNVYASKSNPNSYYRMRDDESGFDPMDSPTVPGANSVLDALRNRNRPTPSNGQAGMQVTPPNQ